VAAAVLLLGACGGAPKLSTAGPTTSSRLRTPAETCTLRVGYWAAELLKAKTDQGYDYQHMGLTEPDYRLVLAITKQAKHLRHPATEEQSLAFVARESARRRAAGRRPPARPAPGRAGPAADAPRRSDGETTCASNNDLRPGACAVRRSRAGTRATPAASEAGSADARIRRAGW
jgi:hypothetical protein